MNLELLKTEQRFNKNQERLEVDFGWSATIGPMAITTNYLKTLADRIPEFLTPKLTNEIDFIELIKDLPKEIIALSLLSTGFDIIGSWDFNKPKPKKNKKHQDQGTYSKAIREFGKALEGECFAYGLLDHDKNLYKRLDKVARGRHGHVKYRRQCKRHLAKKNKFVKEFWSQKDRAIAGNWSVNILLTVLPEIFSLIPVGTGKALALTEHSFNLAEAAIKEAVYARPVYLPSLAPPIAWADFERKDKSPLRATVLRSIHNETAAYVRASITEGTMQPALDALNTIQAVPYRINTKVLEVIKWFHTNAVSHPSLPRAKEIDLPSRDRPWDAMSEDAKKAWKYRANKIKKRNRGLTAERVLLAEDLSTAEFLSEQGVFYTPSNCDFRGRVYSLPHFNYQREDRVRSLFEFAEGVPMTEDGLYWLKIHLANCGDFDKVSKKSFANRIAWVDDNITFITETALMPTEKLTWVNADKPFLFLAACIELLEALNNPTHLTHLPISLDGSCSGLQHLCAMTRASEGALVNLSHSEVPQDIYSVVADTVRDNLIKKESHPGTSSTDQALCTLCLAFGITRGLVKRNVMTYAYSSQKFGMTNQLTEDLMQPLALEVWAGEREDHPFGSDNGRTAARFLAYEIFSTIEAVIKKPAEAMAFLRSMAQAMAHENKAVEWITPIGIPWSNKYHESRHQRVCLWLNDRGVNMKHTASVPNGFGKSIRKKKSADAISPNFVHALDGAHLMMTVNGLKEEGITNVATVHDSFGVHAPNARPLARVLREQFIRLYTEFDPLNDILASNLPRMAVPTRLPQPVTKGPLDIKEILNAEYTFA